MSEHQIISSNLGHGNPAAATAIDLLARQSDIESELVFQSVIPAIGNVVHRLRTSIPALAERYTRDTARAREGRTAELFGKALYLETRYRSSSYGQDRDLHVVQEHPLFGIEADLLERDGYSSVRLLVPDVYPKGSGVKALLKHVGSTAMVWNVLAQERLSSLGIPTELIKPFYLDAFRSDEAEFMRTGLSVVIKSSGSGMPRAWRNALISELSGSDDADWAMHTNKGVYDQMGFTKVDKPTDSIIGFFEDLGGKTEVVIGYPSELAKVVIDMQSRGVPVRFISLAPRGSHEVENMKTLRDLGLLIAELRFDGKSSSIDKVDVIGVDRLRGAIATGSRLVNNEGFTGSVPYWDVVAASKVS